MSPWRGRGDDAPASGGTLAPTTDEPGPGTTDPAADGGAGGAGGSGAGSSGAGSEDGATLAARPGRRFGRGRFGRALEWAAVLLIAAVLALALRTWAFEVFSVPSGSMEPTIQVGDRILVDKAFFNYHGLKPGDIVVFRRPPRDTLGVCAGPEVGDLVKRVVGLPGQTISSRGNTILINGRPQAEPYLPANTQLGRPIQPPVHIPPNHYFVLGDNRANSCDSRYWGTITGSSIVGRVVAIIWHHGHPDLHIF